MDKISPTPQSQKKFAWLSINCCLLLASKPKSLIYHRCLCLALVLLIQLIYNSCFHHGIVTHHMAVYVFIILVLPLLAMSSATPNIDLTFTPSAYIMSHEGFEESPYGNDLYNTIYLDYLPKDTKFTVDFISLNLGHINSCVTSNPSDRFRIYKNAENETLYECGDTRTAPPPLSIDTNATSLLFEFVTNYHQMYSGFLLLYSGKLYLGKL